MSEEKELPILPEGTEPDLLPGPSVLPELPKPDVYLGLPMPEETPLLPTEYNIDSSSVSVIASPNEPDSSVAPTLEVSLTDTSAVSDLSLFDSVGREDVVSNIADTVIPEVHTEPLEQHNSGDLGIVAQAPIPEPSPIPVVPPIIHEETLISSIPEPQSHRGILVTLVVILLIGAVTAGWYFLYYQKSDPIEVVQTNSGEVASMTYTESINQNLQNDEQDIDRMNQALAEGNDLLCNAIVSPSRKLECQESLFARSITASGSVTECQKLTIANIRDNCTSIVVQKNALETLDRSRCTEISDKTQSEYCTELVDQKTLDHLIETGTASDALCAGLSEKYRSQCQDSITQIDDSTLLQKAISQENLDICKSLSKEELQFTCFDTILLKQALKSRDKNLCDYVRDEGKKSTCLSYMKTQDDNSLFKTAILEKNINLCSGIITESLKNRCHDGVTLLVVRDSKDIALCDTMISKDSIAACKKSLTNQ